MNETPERSDDEDNKSPPSTSPPQHSQWVKYTDDEGREYYYDATSGETQWDRPDDFIDTTEPITQLHAAPGMQPDGLADIEVAGDTSKKSFWVEYTDDEGRGYFYNTETGETQWEKPTDYAVDRITTEGADDSANAERIDGERTPGGRSPIADTNAESCEIEEIDPAVQKLKQAETALNNPDSILEPTVLINVAQVVASEGGNPQKAIAALIENYQGQTAICGLLGRWLADLRTASSSSAPSIQIDAPSRSSIEEVREITQEVINKLVIERFSKESGDQILNLSKAEAAFLEHMMDSSRWRKLLIDLSATHKDSAVLVYCLRAISKRGHHREIAKRVNQSDHFAVFNAMLQSELSIIGRVAISSSSDSVSATGIDELLNDLRRACSSTSYTYLYSLEVLRMLDLKAEKLIERTDSVRFRRAMRKWRALAQCLEIDLVDPAAATAVAGTSPLLRKRRLDVALTVSELHQRHRRVRRCHDGQTSSQETRRSHFETALLQFLKRHSAGMQVDDKTVDPLLPSGVDLNTIDETGRLLVDHPLAIRALFGHLFKPGSMRVTSPVLRNKCARLIAFAVLAAEKFAKAESGERGVSSYEPSDEVSVTRMIVDASLLCEQLEIMVSFLVNDSETKVEVSASPGEKLCAMALKCAAVAQGAMMWAREFTHGAEYPISPAFPTISVSILSLVRVLAIRHPFTRREALQIGLTFLGHSNTEISYQKVNAIKEQSLRLLLTLLVKGEVSAVLGGFAKHLKQQTSSVLDASLIRYFVAGVLQCIARPASMEFMRSFCGLLSAPSCLDAVRSSYFEAAHRERLAHLFRTFEDDHSLNSDEAAALESIRSSYQLE